MGRGLEISNDQEQSLEVSMLCSHVVWITIIVYLVCADGQVYECDRDRQVSRQRSEGWVIRGCGGWRYCGRQGCHDKEEASLRLCESAVGGTSVNCDLDNIGLTHVVSASGRYTINLCIL